MGFWSDIKFGFGFGTPPNSPLSAASAQEKENKSAKQSAQSAKSHTTFEIQAAAQDRFMQDFKPGNVGPNYDVRTAIQTLRERARWFEKNDEYAKNFLRQLRINVVGPFGFKMKINSRDKDELRKTKYRQLEQQWKDFGRKENFSVSGKFSERITDQMLITYAGREGEAMFRIVRSKQFKYGVKFEIIPPELLDDSYTEVLSNNRIIALGIEYLKDSYGIWHVDAYHLRELDLAFQVYGYIPSTGKRVRIPANQIRYAFRPDYVNQTRGLSWMMQSMVTLRHLSKYDEATLINARSRVSQGFIEYDKDANGEYWKGDRDDGDNFVVETSPGSWIQLPPGAKATEMGKDFPGAIYDDYVKRNIKRISAGMGSSYATMSNDAADTNYSGQRQALIPERDNYTDIQEWYIEEVKLEQYQIWLEEAYLVGAIDYPVEDEAYYQQAMFYARRWDWIDPLKDIEAKKEEVKMGISSLTEIIAEKGGEIEEVFQQIKEERELAKKYGIDLTLDDKKPYTQSAAAAEDAADEKKKSAEKKKQEAESILAEAKEILSTSGNGIHK